MSTINTTTKTKVIFINKKLLALSVILVLVGITFVYPILTPTQDFDGLFTMNVPMGKHYWDAAWCHSNKALGCSKEYWDENGDCLIDSDDFVVYYYNDSQVSEMGSNAWQHAVDTLTTTFLYEVYQTDGNLLILHNNVDMRNLPEYLVGVSNDDGSEAVFVGGYDLNMLKSYANSVEFK